MRRRVDAVMQHWTVSSVISCPSKGQAGSGHKDANQA